MRRQLYEKDGAIYDNSWGGVTVYFRSNGKLYFNNYVKTTKFKTESKIPDVRIVDKPEDILKGCKPINGINANNILFNK